jgi:hypothetical protein
VAKQLYYYEIEPGDADHLAAYYFRYGVVESDPEGVAAILAAEGQRHQRLLTIKPVQEAAVSLEAFRADLGGGLQTYHGAEVCDDDPCASDAEFIDAYEATFG